ncbi:MAG: LysR substrate-binding domain-containing protein [Azospirillaceae bacterium]
MMDQLRAMTVFVEVAKAASFRAAAARLSLSATAASRLVGELEAHLGVTLLNRTTRKVGLTEAGLAYLPRAEAVLSEVERMDAALGAEASVPSGKLRITSPPSVGAEFIAPVVVDFLDAHPQIDMELDFSERLVDLVEDRFDAAIRSGELASSSLIAHRIVEMRYVLCASPGYLAAHGTPAAPEDLSSHACIHWRGPSSDGSWTLFRGAARVTVPVRGRLLVNSHAVERDALLRGLGLAILPLISVHEDVATGRLVLVLGDWEARYGALSLVRPPTAFMPYKLRLFIDFITAELRRRVRVAEADAGPLPG